MNKPTLRAIIVSTFFLFMLDSAAAHHILGRPASGLNEDSNTPSSLQAEVRIGDFLVTYMIYPAFPKPGEPGQINVTVEGTGRHGAFDGKVTFEIQDNAWYTALGFGAGARVLGVQAADDYVYRQRLVFPAKGDYLITAQFDEQGEPYVIQFPVRIGAASPLTFTTIAVTVIILALILVSLVQRRRLMSGKVRRRLSPSPQPGPK